MKVCSNLSLLKVFAILVSQVYADYVIATDVGTKFKGAREFSGAVASLHMEGYGAFCTGSIISEFVILTSASCLTHFRLHYVRIHSPYSWKEGRQLTILRIDRHHHFSNETLENDIALIEVKESTLSDSRYDFMRMVEQNERVVEGSNASAFGWGLIRYEGSRPSELKRLDLSIVSLSQCRKSHRVSEGYHICAYTMGTGTCDGDGGGPLVIDGKQAGIVSTTQCINAWRDPNSRGFIPGVFTNVAMYREWIDSRVLAMLEERLKNPDERTLPRPIGNYVARAPSSPKDTTVRRLQPPKNEWATIEAEILGIRSAQEQLRIREENLSKLLQDYYSRAGQQNSVIISAWFDSVRSQKKNRCD